MGNLIFTAPSMRQGKTQESTEWLNQQPVGTGNVNNFNFAHSSNMSGLTFTFGGDTRATKTKSSQILSTIQESGQAIQEN